MDDENWKTKLADYLYRIGRSKDDPVERPDTPVEALLREVDDPNSQLRKSCEAPENPSAERVRDSLLALQETSIHFEDSANAETFNDLRAALENDPNVTFMTPQDFANLLSEGHLIQTDIYKSQDGENVLQNPLDRVTKEEGNVTYVDFKGR
jgi:hypothetical protein